MSNCISVIIPTRNRLYTLEKVMPSYLIQKHLKQLIIVDDCSSDSTCEYVRRLSKEDERVILFKNEVRKGAPQCRNIGISLVTGSHVFFGEDDLELSPNLLEVLLSHMITMDADVIAPIRIWLGKDESKDAALKRTSKIMSEVLNSFILTTNCEVLLKEDTEVSLLDASMLVKSTLFEHIKYDPYYRENSWREESDFQLSCAEQGYKLVFCPYASCFHYYKEKDRGGNHGNNLLTYEYQILKNNLYFLKKHKHYINKHYRSYPILLRLLGLLLYRIWTKYSFNFIVRTKKLLFRS